MRPGEVWSLGEVGDPSSFLYLVLEADCHGVDLVLIDSSDEPNCEPGDRISLSWDDLRHDDGRYNRPIWNRVSGVKPVSRLGQAFLDPGGALLLVVSDPWLSPWVSETEWWHDVVAFPAGARFSRREDTLVELETRPGWTRIA